MNFFWLIVCALAAFRLAELLVIDDGPFDMFYNLRGWAHKPPTGTFIRGTLAGILGCIYCAGLWMAVLVGFLYISGNSIIQLLLFILAIAGLQSIFARNIGRTSL
jgi:hypothetical protein